jgi:predicted amidophosphoribosyltransferase
MPRRPLLSRTRETPPQSSLSAPGRRANVEGAFAASAGARGRVLVLVDDVVTTGATLFAAARALRAAGALEVRGLVLARTPEPA